MPEPATYIFFSGAQYYPEGGAGDNTVVLHAEDDDAAMEQAERIDIDLSDRHLDWWRLDKIEGDQLVPVSEGWVGDRGLIVDETVDA